MVFSAREVTPPPSGAPPRLIYLDETRVRSLLEQIASGPGSPLLGPNALNHPGSVLAANNPRVLLAMALAKSLSETGTETCFDLTNSCMIATTDRAALHPGQAVVLTGTVPSAREITPSGFRLEVTGESMRVLVDRDHALHLNQVYLTSKTLAVIGRVSSVSRRQLRAIGIWVLDGV